MDIRLNFPAFSLARAAGLAAALSLGGAPVSAQTCEAPKGSNEAGIFGSRSLGLVFGRGIAISRDAPGTIRVGAEAALLPNISDAKATPTACRPGKGPENVNALPAFARLRAGIALPWQLTLEGSWLPPVTLKGMRANIGGISLGRAQDVTPSVVLVVRAHTLFGSVTGPFTCAEDDLRDEGSECFGGTLSSDRFSPNIAGGDVSIDWTRQGSAVTLFGGAGYSHLAPRFQVHFRNAVGDLDATRVRVNLGRTAIFAGATRVLAEGWRAGGELYGTLEDGATIRLVFDGVVRRGGVR